MSQSGSTNGDSQTMLANTVPRLLSTLGPLDPIEIAKKQVKDLELLLAQTKLDLVESQCRNQDLTHQMNTLIGEIQSNKSSWQPWLAKTINSIQEKVVSTKRDLPSFQSYTSNSPTSSYNSLVRALTLIVFCMFNDSPQGENTFFSVLIHSLSLVSCFRNETWIWQALAQITIPAEAASLQ